MKTNKITESRFSELWDIVTQETKTAKDYNDGETYFSGKRDFRRFLELYLKIDVVPDSPTD